MGVDKREQPFDSIESAYEFMDILAQTMMGVMVDLHRDYQIAMQDGETRRARAIELALFKSKNLACCALFAVVTPAADFASFDADVVDSAGNLYLCLNGYRTVQFRETVDLRLMQTAEAHS